MEKTCQTLKRNFSQTDNWHALHTLLVLSIVFPSYENYLPFSWLFWPKHHVYVKRQTRHCTTWPSFPITCRLLFIISMHKLVVSRNFLSPHFLFLEILNLNQPFAVCRIREVWTLYFVHKCFIKLEKVLVK